MATATTTRKATKPKAAKTKATPRDARKTGDEVPTPVPGDPGRIPAANGVEGEGGAAMTAEASGRDEAAAANREGRDRPECDCWWTARRISPGRAEAMREVRERLARMFEGMDDFICCMVHLDGAGGAEFRLRVGEDHGLRIRLDADPDC